MSPLTPFSRLREKVGKARMRVFGVAAVALALAGCAAELPQDPCHNRRGMMIGDAWIIHLVFFRPGEIEISEQNLQNIRKGVKSLEDHGTKEFHLVGYTDDTGSDAEKLQTARLRAELVAEAMETLGIKTPITHISGYGESRASWVGFPEEFDRRVEIRPVGFKAFEGTRNECGGSSGIHRTVPNFEPTLMPKSTPRPVRRPLTQPSPR